MRVDRGIDDEGRAWVRIHGGEHVIERAWCVEREALTTIDEAREAYFAQPSAHGKRPPRLGFLCPDTRCREAFAPTISGVNHDKSADRGDAYSLQPHFRWVEARAHAAGCSLVADCLGASPREPRTKPTVEDTGVPRESAPKEHDHIDLFVLPPKHDQGNGRGSTDDDEVGDDDGRRVGRDAHGAGKAKPTQTTRLSRLFIHYRSLAKNMRAFDLSFFYGGESMKYGEWFRRFNTGRKEKSWLGYPARFWRGNAKPVRTGDGWRLEFYDRFPQDGEEYPVRLAVRERDLRRSAGGRKMLRVMREAREARASVAACFLGVLDWGYGPQGDTEIVGVPESVAAVTAVHVR
ncbi:MAG: hypothetical protein JO079_11140 [Frankiaceae bacterium]|nr:hypothetical protein [Frankiaceae bacterium]